MDPEVPGGDNGIILHIEHLSDPKCLNTSYLNLTLRTIPQGVYYYDPHF